MNIWEHFGELRTRLLRCIYVLFAGIGIGAFLVDRTISWLAKPVGELVFLHPTEAFAAQLKVAVGISFLIGLPYFLWQAWSFVGQGLKASEKRYVRVVVPCSYILFMGGAAFSTFWVFPKAVDFLLTLKSEHLAPMLSVESYLNFFALLAIAFGLLFQLPLVLHFLARLGVMRAEFLEGNRRMGYFLIFVLATLFNPVPEVFTQLLLAFAAIALFELSILLMKFEARRKTR
jgi:sec-independent protein translocase protein TatC